MTIDVIHSALGWCTLLNMGLLLYWFLFFRFAHDWLQRMHGRWFRLSIETFDSIHYVGMATFKIGIFMFNLVPYLALFIVR